MSQRPSSQLSEIDNDQKWGLTEQPPHEDILPSTPSPVAEEAAAVCESNHGDDNRDLERRLVRKIDLRLCTIAGMLCSLNLLDSGIISSASVTTIFEDLGLGVGNRYSVAILVYTVASVAFQLPATIAVRIFGPRLVFSIITVGFGLVTMCTAFITNWQQMVGLRVLLGIMQSSIFPGLSYLISTWYTRKEQQLRFAFLQSGEVIILGLGGFLNFGLNHLNGRGGLKGWQWMFLVQGLIAIVIGFITYLWIVDFPENSHKSFRFLSAEEQAFAENRITEDRDDVQADPFSWRECLIHFLDPKLYLFAMLFFCLNLVSTSLSYFLPIILQAGMGFSTDKAILLSAPPYFYAVIPVIISSIVGDRYQLRGLVITFNCLCTIAGFGMLGFSEQVTVRYVGTYLATGAYISNWAAMTAYQTSNIATQWKRVTFSGTIVACNGLGGIAGSFIVRQQEAPRSTGHASRSLDGPVAGAPRPRPFTLSHVSPRSTLTHHSVWWTSQADITSVLSQITTTTTPATATTASTLRSILKPAPAFVLLLLPPFHKRGEAVVLRTERAKMGFLGIYKAIYDYTPQGESELTIAEGDILYVLEKSGEDDWWRAKKRATGEDEDEPEGLIPNNYIQEAEPISHARALYDYTRQTDEELSFSEDAQLEVFDTSDPDWILVGLDGEYGFAPANYIEVQDEKEQEKVLVAQPRPPILPRRPAQAEAEDEPETPESPISPVQSPAAALANVLTQRKLSAPAARPTPPQYTPEASDEDEPPTPTLPARPVSQARVPDRIDVQAARSAPHHGVSASPPYNRATHRGIDEEVAQPSPQGFHMYNINEMVSVMGKRKKMPTTLGINMGTGVILIAPEKTRDGPEQKWTAEKMQHYSLEGKHVFLELVRPSKSVDFHAGAKDTAEEIVSALGELAGAVRAGGLQDEIMAGSGQAQKKGQILYDFMAQGDDEVTVAVGDEVIIIDDTRSEEWWQVRRLKTGKEGVVPSSYIEITGTISVPSMSGLNAGRSGVDQNRFEEERLAKESLKAARREEDSRGSEVGPGMRLPERGSSLSAIDNTPQQRSRRESGRNDSSASRSSKSKPDPTKVRTWTDRSKSFSVDAQFLALKDGKINLHKMNGVKIAVPVVKMSVEDLEYVERITGVSLDEDKPLSDIKKQRSRQQADSRSSGSQHVGATIERSQKPEYDWFQFFLSCDVNVGLCERYAQAFQKDSMDESVLPDIDATILRTLGLREGDIIKVMKALDKKFARSGGKRGVSFGGEEVIGADGDGGGLFSGPGGTLRNNTRKGRPAPAVQTPSSVDPNAFSQDAKDKDKPTHEGVATPIASAPIPAQKDVARSGFDDDAWDVKPSKQQPQPPSSQSVSQPSQAPTVSAPAQVPALTSSMQEISLLSQPLEPTKAQPLPQVTQAPAPQPQPQAQGPPPVTPSVFAGIGNQQTGLPQQQTGANMQFNPQMPLQQGIARPPPGQFQPQTQGGLMIPAPPSRPLSAPQVNQQSAFSIPPLQAQTTGMQTSAGFQSQIAPPGQSLNDLRMMTGYNGQQNMPQNNMGMMNQPQNFNQFNNPQVPNGFQYPMQTGMPQQNFMNNGAGPFADPRPQQFSPAQQQPTGFQSSFGQPQQQFPQPTGVNSFLPPPLQPTPTGMQQQNGFQSSFSPPPVPPIPQQNTAMPLVPQKTGPPPPVRFGVSGDTKKLMPQATGRRANLAHATPQNPFGF
ncbi:uncharacterized protein BP5553_02772 [Venustampulla echinocandica]|uniref:Actin cytoskeleton-regulatory complex protein SLA1 n=1 Tax=Venustampulla echinocandica TaxID=2656787 RepID=A0A370TSB8_9HELO|nr:uncharacterized protein BP5553_02772 [Venustampulla echinocandica]RDL38432.1 hypothetical protein BP5553_02772 [Venustampulla echinocandica]